MNKLNPLVSIIIPAYNASEYIQSTIESVLRQTYSNIQIIVIDDGSIDNTYQISSRLLENIGNHKVIRQVNSGVSCARNTGIKNCEGEYICFLDSDDYYDEKFIHCIMTKILADNLDLCYCGFKEDVCGRIKKYKYGFIEGCIDGKELLDQHLNKKTYLCTCSVIYKKRLIDENNILYSEDYKYGEDQEFIIRCLINSKRVGCVKKDLVSYVYRSNSATYKFNESRFSGVLAFQNAKSKLNDEEYTLQNLIDKRIAEELYWIAKSYSNSFNQVGKLKTLLDKYNYKNYVKEFKRYLTVKQKYIIFMFLYFPYILRMSSRLKMCIKKSIVKLINSK